MTGRFLPGAQATNSPRAKDGRRAGAVCTRNLVGSKANASRWLENYNNDTDLCISRYL